MTYLALTYLAPKYEPFLLNLGIDVGEFYCMADMLVVFVGHV